MGDRAFKHLSFVRGDISQNRCLTLTTKPARVVCGKVDLFYEAVRSIINAITTLLYFSGNDNKACIAKTLYDEEIECIYKDSFEKNHQKRRSVVITMSGDRGVWCRFKACLYRG